MAFVDKLLVPGDRVVMKMDKEARGWHGDNYPPDGTQGTFKGCTRIQCYSDRQSVSIRKPGIYECNGVAIIEWDDGSTAVDGWSHEMLDKEEYDRRFKAYHAIPNKHFDHGDNFVWLSELPETKFWEGDIVRITSRAFANSDMPKNLRVHHINYNWKKDYDDRGWCYDVEWVDENGEYARRGSTLLHDNELELVKRGNIWKEYHGEPTVFRDLKDEIAHEHFMGRVNEVRNPANNLYAWEKVEVLAAIQNKIVDGFSMGSVFGGTPRINAFKLKNEEIGKRLREATMYGFDMTP